MGSFALARSPGPFQSSLSVALAKRIAALGTRMPFLVYNSNSGMLYTILRSVNQFPFLHSRPQLELRSCHPFGQRHGSRALAGSGGGSPRITDFWLPAQPQKFETIIILTVTKMGSFALARSPGPCQSSLSVALANRIAALGTRMPFLVYNSISGMLYTILRSVNQFPFLV